eukprot:GDKH01019233.1.p1 GENE.GDKH01019233.1~~GDKH01019233.1.p1  ORF type:complete len:149 (-),score=3.71 GDKH01019233.1:187-633(-)
MIRSLVNDGCPRHIHEVTDILEDMDVESFEPDVALQLVAVMQQEAKRIVDTALDLARTNGRDSVEQKDISLAASLTATSAIKTNKRKEIATLAAEVNRLRIPTPSGDGGLVTLRDTLSLSMPNWGVTLDTFEKFEAELEREEAANSGA